MKKKPETVKNKTVIWLNEKNTERLFSEGFKNIPVEKQYEEAVKNARQQEKMEVKKPVLTLLIQVVIVWIVAILLLMGNLNAQTSINFYNAEDDGNTIIEQSFIMKDGYFHAAVWMKKIQRSRHYFLAEEYYGIPTRKVRIVQANHLYSDADLVGYFIDEQYYFNGKQFFDEDGIEVKLEELDFIDWAKVIVPINNDY